MVARIPLNSEIGRSLAGQLGIRGVPTLVVYDAEGNEVLRQVGTIRKRAVLDALGLQTEP
ncbi:MAG: TlpA family protein disulfide reductase [Anaerolineae bacterium]